MCSAERELVGHGNEDTGILQPLLRSGKVLLHLCLTPTPPPTAMRVENFQLFFFYHKWPSLEMTLVPPDLHFMMLKTIFKASI